MKKDNNLLKFTSFVLLVVMIALILVASTFAKYTSQASGSDTAIVAKWSFKVNGTDITLAENNQEITFDLFNTINEENGGTEEDVAKATEGNPSIIAPGTSGSFKLLVENASEVTAKYSINFGVDSYYMKAPETEGGEPEKVNVSIPLQYYIANDEISDLSTISDEEWDDSLETISDRLAINSGEQSKIVYWKWAFENNNDENDTLLGINTPTVTVTATITAEQFDASEDGADEDEVTVLVNGVGLDTVGIFQYTPGTILTLTTKQGHANIRWTIDDLDEQYSSNFVDNGDGTATFTIPEGTEGSSWWVNAEIEGTDDYPCVMIYSVAETPVMDLEAYSNMNMSIGLLYNAEGHHLDNGVSTPKNIYLEAGTKITANGEWRVGVLPQSSEQIEETSTTPEDAMSNLTESIITIQTSGWYGIVVSAKDLSPFDENNIGVLGDYVIFSK